MVDLFRPVLVVLTILFVVSFVYGIVTNDYDSEEFTVTVTYSCNQVLPRENDYPDQVVDTCKRLQRSFNQE